MLARMSRTRRTRVPLALVATMALALVGSGCTREVAAGLDESDANRGVVALSRAGVEAEKLADAQTEGKFKLIVGRDEATVAISVLASEEIPRAKLASATQGALVPTPEADRAARIAATAMQIERSIASIDGVHDARVHLDVPVVDPLFAALGTAPEKTPRATASVLIRHRSATPPIAEAEVKRLVSGAVSGLPPEAVAVVMVQVPVMTPVSDRELAHLGPIAVTRGSLATLRLVAVVALLAIAGLATALVVLAVRLRRLREEPEPEGRSVVAR